MKLQLKVPQGSTRPILQCTAGSGFREATTCCLDSGSICKSLKLKTRSTVPKAVLGTLRKCLVFKCLRFYRIRGASWSLLNPVEPGCSRQLQIHLHPDPELEELKNRSPATVQLSLSGFQTMSRPVARRHGLRTRCPKDHIQPQTPQAPDGVDN